jgi:hypothetical protein
MASARRRRYSLKTMSLRHIAVLAFATYAALACVQARSSPPRDAALADKGSESANDAVSCKADRDCPALACGPCTPGTPITEDIAHGPECAVNPCLNAKAVCNAQHVCVVGPGTTKNPAVWKRPSD